MTDERRLALKSLLRVFCDGAFSGPLVDSGCNELKDPMKKAFYTRLFMGTLENAVFCDYLIRKYSSRKLKDISRVVLNILRLGIYQLFFMDSVPDAAAVDTSNILCEKTGNKKAKPFVNGILREIARDRAQDDFIESILPEGIDGLSVRYSVPQWITEYLSMDYDPEQITDLYENFRGEHFISLRVNTSKITMEKALNLLKDHKLNPELINGIPAIRILQSVSPDNIPGLSEGYFYIQDISSIRAVSALSILPGEKILDLCAAPGGKGLFAAELTGKDGFVTMRDANENRLLSIDENAKRLGITNVKTEIWDATELDPKSREAYDVVICDLPCSGLGTIGNKPEVRYRVKKADVHALSDIQADILKIAPEYVKPGGRIMFSTCTMGNLENTQNTKKFLARRTDFKILTENQLFPDGMGSDGFYYMIAKRLP